MDVYFSPDAYECLQAVSRVVSPQTSDGLVIGHKRGPSFFVEKVMATSKGFFPSFKKYDSLNSFFKDKILGFYSFSTDERKTQKILAPFAYGKLYLDIQILQTRGVIIKPFLIEYDDKFFLSPLKFQPPRPKA
jgi:hypothetical protein